MTPRPRAGLPRLLLLAAIVLFLGVAAPQLHLPGLHNDEAQEAGLQALQILRGQPIDSFRGAGVTVGGRAFPLMVQDYIGAVNVYLALPFVATLGATPIALRWMTLALGVLALLLTYAVLAEAVNPRAAAVAALLLAANPSFVFWQRQGIYVSAGTLVLWLAAAWAGARWSKRGGWAWAGAVGLASGFGLYAKLLFVWIIGGFAAAIALVNAVRWLAGRRRPQGSTATRAWPRRPTLPEALAFVIGGVIGLSPLLAYNLLSGGTFASVGGNLSTSYYGVDNLNALLNLVTRVDQWRAVLAGRDHLWYLGGSFGNPYTEWALGLALAGLLAAGARRAVPAARGAFFPLVFLFSFLQTGFTVSGLFPTHFAILLPLPAMILGIAVDGLMALLKRASSRVWLPALALAPALLIVGRDLWVDVSYHRALQRSGGLGPHSDAIYRLEAFLAEQAPGAPLVAMDWGFAPQLRYLSSGTIAPAEVFGYTWEADPGFPERLGSHLADSRTLYLFHWPQETIFHRREAFDALAAEHGLTPITLVDISRGDGAPVFQIVKLVAP